MISVVSIKADVAGASGNTITLPATTPGGAPIVVNDLNNLSKTIIFASSQSASDVQTYLRDISFTSPSTGNQSVTITVDGNETTGVNSASSITSYLHEDGTIHYYAYVPSSSSFIDAYNAAKQMTFMGMKGYLVTITSPDENDILTDISTAEAWSGGLRGVNSTGARVNDPISITSSDISYQTGSVYYWTSGPEAGLIYFNGKTHTDTTVNPSGGRLVSSAFYTQFPGFVNTQTNSYGYPWLKFSSNYLDWEPNNSSNLEDTMQVNFKGSTDYYKWNDIPYTETRAFFVEFGGYSSAGTDAIKNNAVSDPGNPDSRLTASATSTNDFTPPSYTITFDSAGGSAVSSITQQAGTSVTAPDAPTKEGYTFNGWSPALPATMPSSSNTHTAQWTINQYTITFDSDGGSSVTAITQNYGTTVTAPDAPTKTGYTFNGWSPALPSTMPAASGMYTAQWTINQYTITFNTDGGSSAAAITQNYGTAVTAPDAPTKEGYTFNGWSPALPATMPSSSNTHTAQWTINQYTITFDTDEGSSVTAITQNYGTTVTAPDAPTKEGYTFTNWDVAVPSTMPAGNMTITAQWTINSYTISFNSAGGTSVSSVTQNYGSSVTEPISPTRTGYTFVRWSPVVPATMPSQNLTLLAIWSVNQYTLTFDSAGGSAVADITMDYNSVITEPADPVKEGYIFAGGSPDVPVTMPAGNVALTAQWAVNQYTITFDSAGGSAVSGLTQNYGTAVAAPADPVKEGYTFMGWSPILPSTMPANNITLTATWSLNHYIVSFITYATPIPSVVADHGGIVSEPSTPVRDGYYFAGWYSDSYNINEWDFSSDTVTSNTTIYASWSRTEPENLQDDEAVIVIVNGKEENAGIETKGEENGRSAVSIAVDPNSIEEKINEAITQQSEQNTIEIPVKDKDSDIANVALTGDIVKKLESNNFNVMVTRNDITYDIPAKEFTIENVANNLEVEASDLRDIEVEIKITKANENAVTAYEKAVRENQSEIIFPPVEFEITAKTTKTDGTEEYVNISKFNNYVERIMEIPAGVDPSKITTGILFNPDGSYVHVPTVVFEKGGKYYAKLSSLTNSTYSVIWNPLTVASVDNHWSKTAVNDMASRLIVSNPDSFEPDSFITRGEFVEYITKALGIYRKGAQPVSVFKDLSADDKFSDAISAAYEYGIIKGYEDNTLRLNEKITRQEAMIICNRAMMVVQAVYITIGKVEAFADKKSISIWAYDEVSAVVDYGIFVGNDKNMLLPGANFKYSEAATAVRNLLMSAGLINK